MCIRDRGYTGDGVSCEKDNVVGGGDYVGSYNVQDGSEWGGNPPGYSCLQACAQVFGGSAEDYQCSTQQDSIDNQGNYTVWGVGGCQVYDEDYVKSPGNYNCGQEDCAASAYTKDNCYGTNYCFTAGVEGVEINSGQGFGHHGQCEGWNGCGDAKTCAEWACNWAGYAKLVSYGKEAPCNSGEFSTCHLFNSPGDLDENWGTSCAVMGVGEILSLIHI